MGWTSAILIMTCKNEDGLIFSLIVMIKKHVKEKLDVLRTDSKMMIEVW